ncbi:hypothetical protein OK18_02625 [Chryseobacterium gallinarum]|uniref:CatB-related O-acetyltransferase n=1 Tax=Chryseobacterium gallinarum TaxID=1324352 RepID=A0A0G3M777_CHRGL|nr:CatB-related O-acetyltransferase [Chryseobacterium gallinarum]AKK74754.1 hypothetical protein OK18_02625 [Chryseobacterium gallinarum]
MKIISDLRATKRQIEWRFNNKHNSTTLSHKVKNSDIIKVGNESYGEIITESYENSHEGLQIGNYVSIASNVIFVLGGNHQLSTFTSYPLKSMFIKNSPEDDAQSKGTIIVEDEVWIGSNVIILSGVTLGKGSIIAAGSVVTKSVEPFSIVGGNPAKIIKFRLSENLIEKRKKIDLLKISKKDIIANIDLFYSELTETNLQEIINLEKE